MDDAASAFFSLMRLPYLNGLTGEGSSRFERQKADTSAGNGTALFIGDSGSPNLSAPASHKRLGSGAQFAFAYRIQKRCVVFQANHRLAARQSCQSGASGGDRFNQ